MPLAGSWTEHFEGICISQRWGILVQISKYTCPCRTCLLLQLSCHLRSKLHHRFAYIHFRRWRKAIRIGKDLDLPGSTHHYLPPLSPQWDKRGTVGKWLFETCQALLSVCDSFEYPWAGCKNAAIVVLAPICSWLWSHTAKAKGSLASVCRQVMIKRLRKLHWVTNDPAHHRNTTGRQGGLCSLTNPSVSPQDGQGSSIRSSEDAQCGEMCSGVSG